METRIINDRSSVHNAVEMHYHGAGKEPLVTVFVQDFANGVSFEIAPDINDIVDCYNHPYAQHWEKFRVWTQAA